jgi:signal transduction histidine kinase
MSSTNFLRELARSGSLTFLTLALLAVLVTFLFNAVRPPTVEEVERDIWKDWARATVDNQGENIDGLLRRGRRAACAELLRDFGQTVEQHGDSFVVRAAIRQLRVRDEKGDVFVEWTPTRVDPVDDRGWSNQSIPLAEDFDRPSGTLDVTYKFNESTLGALPNLRRLAALHNAARWLVAVVAIVMLVAAIANLQRLRERAARLQSQQVTLDLARQMCHELRNGLWAFSLEGNNIRQLFELVDDYFEKEPAALAEAADKIGLSPADQHKMRRQVQKLLADHHLDPQTDLLSANALARDAQHQIENFSRYINLTVEQLDRNLLGADSAWEPETLQVVDAWREACELLQLRFHSAGVTVITEVATQRDWILADRRALVHVFVNLAKNAVEAMRDRPGDRLLSFRVTRDADTVDAVVHNVGKPIPPDLLPHLFQRGFSTKAGAGRGIGLALVRESVVRMQGEILVASDQAGTSFRLRWPASSIEPSLPHAGSQDENSSPS